MPDVAALLRDSMAAHDAAKQARASRIPDRDFLVVAYDFREQAHHTDPEHTNPAWQAEQYQTPSNQDTHEALMAFYRQRLGL